jgi:ribosome biogenesis GTPase A
MSRQVPETVAPAGTEPVRAALRALSDVARRHRQEAVVREAESLARRAAEGRFFLAVVGQFKRGKSTLINAFLGTPLLPTGVVPVTAVVTFVEHGEQVRARVQKRGGGEEEISVEAIADFVTEERNPGNRRGVAAVVVRHPAALLREGIGLVDTPGVGSVFELSSAATHSFVPRIDAALVVLGADPPISADELDLVETIAREVPDLLFVLNKADLVSEAERVEAASFCARILAERLRRLPPEMLFVSAKRALACPEDTDSGLDAIRKRLSDLAERGGARLVLRALERGVGRLAGELIGALGLERRALTEPIEDLGGRIEEFRRQSREIARMLDDLDYQLRAEVDKTSRWLRTEAQAWVEAETPGLTEAVAERVSALRDLAGRRLREAAAREVRTALKGRLDGWLRGREPLVEERYRRLTDEFVEAANACASRISEAAGRTLGLSVDPTPPEPGLRQASRLYYRLDAEALLLDVGSAMTRLADLFSGREQALVRVREASAAQAQHFLQTNVARIVDDLGERVEESLRRFQFDLRDRLEAALRTAEEAQARATNLKRTGSAAVADAVQVLDSDLADLVRLRQEVAERLDPAVGETMADG